MSEAVLTPDSGGKRSWWVPVVAVAAALATAGTGGLLTNLGEWYYGLQQPGFKPPDWVFGPVWTTLFALMATAGTLAWWAGRPGRALVVAAFAANAVLNVGWSALFFYLQRPDWSLYEVPLLWLSVLALIIVCGRRRALAGWLLVPYLVWVSLASAINYQVVQLNGPFGG